jgi:thymidylate kinase
MFIEFTGMVGAGKSTVAAELKGFLRENGVQALSPVEAMRCGLERSRLGRALERLAPAGRRGRRLRSFSLRALDLCYRLSFACERPRLVWCVLTSQLRRTIPWWHRRKIIGLFFEVAGRYQFLRHRLRAGEAVVLEEGFVHRAINLYAWEPGQIDPDRVEHYLALVPASDLVVLVRAPLDVCLERARLRGLPTRLRDKDQRTIDRFMVHSDRIIAIASAFLAGQRREAIDVDNGGRLEDGIAGLRNRLRDGRIAGRGAGGDREEPFVRPQQIGS